MILPNHDISNKNPPKKEDRMREMNNTLTKFIIRILVGLYFVYLSVKLFGYADKSSEGLLLTIIGIIFLVASVAFIAYSLKTYLVSRKSLK